MERLLLRIRGETIKYASYIKKKMSENEKNLDIENSNIRTGQSTKYGAFDYYKKRIRKTKGKIYEGSSYKVTYSVAKPR